MQRRSTRLLALSVAATAGLTTLVATGSVGQAAPARGGNEIRNVIYLLGDGMGRTHVTAGRIRYYGAAGKMNMEKLPYTGAVSTYAVEPASSKPALVTDSASAATAWSSGVKTYNAAIGVDAFGRVVPTLMEQSKRAGLRTGNVSTAEITDATPAAQFSHALLRGCQGPVYTAAACTPEGVAANPASLTQRPIAEQIARNGTADVILGGGLSRFEPDDEAALERQGYQVLGSFGDPALPAGGQTADSQRVATRAELQAARSRKVVGLFNRGNLTVETAKASLPAAAPQKAEPTLTEMTRKAIGLLQNRRGFYLQVEGALIDKRSHANDANQTLGEQKEFDDAVQAAVDFARRDRHTLVIVTADHECAGFNIIEKGSFTNAESAAPPGNVDSGNPANNSTPSRSSSGYVRDPARSTGPVNGSGSTDAKNFAPATFRTPDDPAAVADGSTEASLWLSYLSGNHTGADVPIYAYGPGGQVFATSQDNTDLYDKVRNALPALRNQPYYRAR